MSGPQKYVNDRANHAINGSRGRWCMRARQFRALDLAVLALDEAGALAGVDVRTGRRTAIAPRRARLAVDLLADALHGLLKVVRAGLHARDIVSGDGVAYVLDLALYLAAQAG